MERSQREEDPKQQCQHRGILLPTLRAMRRSMALSQGQLAERAGVSANTVRLLESGQRGSYPSTVQKLAAALGVAPEELMREDLPEKERST